MSDLLRSNLAVASGTAASRVTGLLRVVTFGYVLGKSSLTDAYNQANASPNLVYELLIGGILSSALVPLFTRLHEEGDEEGETAVRSVIIVALVVLTIVAVLAAPLIVRLYASRTAAGVDPELYHEVSATLAGFFLVQIFFYGMNAVAGAQLQARRRFLAAAWTPALSNLVIIITLLYVPRTVHQATAALGDVVSNRALRLTLGLGATAGIAVMAVALIPPLAAAGVRFNFRFEPRHPAVVQLRQLSGWALGYVVANQVAILVVQRLLVRSGEGNQSAYTYAFTFFVLPHGLLGVSIATTFLPELARAISARDRARLVERTDLGIRLVALLTIPAGFGLFVLRRAIAGLMQHGKCEAACTFATSRALGGFALGLGAFSVYLFALRPFYAHHDARTPCIINIGENLVNIVLAIVLYRRFGLIGIAAAFAVAYVVSAAWALTTLSYKIRGFPLRPVWQGLKRMTLASVAMAEVVWLVARVVGSNAGSGAVVRLVVAGAAGVATYIAALAVFGAPELAAIRARFTKGAATPGTAAG